MMLSKRGLDCDAKLPPKRARVKPGVMRQEPSHADH